jgi:phosphate transport system substrate-binding protein
MKKLLLFAGLFLFTLTSLQAQQVRTIRITGTRLAYPLFQRWAEEYGRQHPDIRIVVARVPADSADILIVSHRLGVNDIKQGWTERVVARYVQLPVVNLRRRDVASLQSRGFDDSAFRRVYFSATGESPSPYQFTVYKRQQPACASISFANHFGSEQKDIKGVGVTGDDKDLLAAVKKDTGGISYNNLGFLYDLITRRPVDSIAIIPIDLNGNGRIDGDEDIYGSLDQVIGFVEKTHHPKIPLEDVHVLYRNREQDKDVADFLRWASTEGQAFSHAYGFIKISNRE